MNKELSPSFYQRHLEPLLKDRDSEQWHVWAREMLHMAESNPLTLQLLELFAYKHRRFTDPRLEVKLGGGEVVLDNPVMVGAGWDKVGNSVKALHRLGFSGVEVGTVVQHPQPGNEKPRQFMIGPGVALNRLGFNSPGMAVVAESVRKYRNSGLPIGISLGKNKEIPAAEAPKTHAIVADTLYDDASYFAINVSSPNTPGLRDLQDKGPLKDISQAVKGVMRLRGKEKPLFVKVAPDLTNTALDDVIDVVLSEKLTGIIATNTSNNVELKSKYGEHWAGQMGGVSGDDENYRQMATEKVRHIYKQTQGKIEIIGVGGVKNGATAWEKITSGASAVQVVTAIRGEGPAVAGRINYELLKIMDREGIKHISEAVGIAMLGWD